MLVLGLAGHRRRLRAVRRDRRDDVRHRYPDVPRPQRVPRGDLLHLLVQPHPRRVGRGRRDLPPCHGNHPPGVWPSAGCALRILAEETADATTVAEALELAARSLAEHVLDLPFILLYRVDAAGQTADLLGSSGIPPGTPASPERVDLSRGGGGWPLDEIHRSPRTAELEDLVERFGHLGCGPYEESPKAAFLCPITLAGGDHPSVIVVAGVSPRRPLDAAYRGFYAMLRDALATAVSKAHSYAEEKRRAEALAEIDRAKTAFFSNVSHEFRTPLTLMLGPLEELLGRGGLAGDGRERLEVIHRNGLRLLKLVNSLLDFSRIEAGRSRAVFEPVDLSALTAELAGLFRSAIEAAGLRFRVECGPLPGPVYVDREMWEKVLFNLLSNAFKFTLGGEIAVELRPGPDCVRLAVRDTGAGIPEAELPHIFERFHRVVGAVGRSFEGSGIGLALVKELVRMHGGTIGVTSTPGRGARSRSRSRRAPGTCPRSRSARRGRCRPRPCMPRRSCRRSETGCPRRLGTARAGTSVACREETAHRADRMRTRAIGPASCSPTTTPTCAITSGACCEASSRCRPSRTETRPSPSRGGRRPISS